MKRRATSTLTREGELIPDREEPIPGEDATPEQIQKRKIFRARRPMRQPVFKEEEKVGFKLQTTLISKELEEQLLSAKPNPVNFLSIPDPEIKEVSPQKQQPQVSTISNPLKPEPKPQSPSALQTLQEQPKTQPSKPEESKADPKVVGFASIIQSLTSKSDDAVRNSFIKTATPKLETLVSTPSFSNIATPTRQTLTPVITIECKLGINDTDRGEGILEMVIGKISDKKVAMIILRNQIKNVIYQAVLTSNSKWKVSSDMLLREDHNDTRVEMEIPCVRKAEKLYTDKCKVAVTNQQKEKLEKAEKEVRDFLLNK